MTQKTYDRQTAKFLAVVGENMPVMTGDVMQSWIENPKVVGRVLEAFRPSATKSFPTWKTVTLGGHKNVKAFLVALESADFHVGDWAKDVMSKPAFTLAKKKAKVNLVRVTVKELGFVKGATLKEIYASASERGLKLCPPEVGPTLRLEYKDQPNGEWLTVAMDPITDSDGTPFLFGVDHGSDERWLNTFWIFPEFVWYPEDEFVFAGS